MSTERSTSRVAALFVDHLPTVAGGAILLWLLVEFATRRGLTPVLSGPLGTTVGAGAVSVTVGFTVAAFGIAWWGRQAAIKSPDWEYTLSRRTVAAGIAGTVGLYVLRGVAVVVLTTGFGLELPTETGLDLIGAPVWALAAFLLVNGIVGPVTEELAWRGVIQTAITEAYGTYVAIVVTAVAFVGKHLVVDLAVSPFRTVSLLVLGAGLCALRARYGTASSTVAHVLMNSLETTIIVLSLG